MKKYIIFIASAVLMMTACAKEEINTTTGGKEFFSIELNAATKTQLDGNATVWTEGDKVRVTVGGVSGELTLSSDLKTFTGELETGGLKGELEAIINYPANVTSVPNTQEAVAGSFAEEAALLEGTTTLAELRKGNGGELVNKTALLQFSVAEAGDVTFTIGTATYTVEGCVANTAYYACVDPVTTGVALSYTVGGNKGVKSKTGATFSAGRIYDLGTLETLENAVLRINNKNGWGDLNITIKQGATTLVNAKPMINEGNNIFAYELDPNYIGKEVTYFISHSWYTTSTKTTTLKADSEATAITLNTIYLQPGTWDQNSATFGAWIWGTGVADKMVTGVKVSDDFFEFEIPADGYKNVIFLRCNKNNAAADWSRVWNQTQDLTLKHMCFCVHSWTQSDLTDARWF